MYSYVSWSTAADLVRGRRLMLVSGRCLALPLLLLLLAQSASALRCVSCQLSSREECANGTVALADNRLQTDCLPSQPYCLVSRTDSLPSSDNPFEVERGCTSEEKFSCVNNTEQNTRTCQATCQVDLCNTADDVAKVVSDRSSAAVGSRPSMLLVPLAVAWVSQRQRRV
ncbi:uncharacterized protein LOC119104438 [Pollicipes pollicipes]|uniref:uncharacterized protein LOC119104438 n=1 Tax=Pollicipes pollicipes TaxID=41117 RepID=UPI00188520C7|nr:uncharacterized protein LOC119104438 [Pollicipes pollicipes]XP_037084029.1 uncharacterized protein LOC119104438 [Pollicipes pollicipes]